MQRVICFANMKGGVGKTTLCVNLAFTLFRQGNKVLVVDNDPQFNATMALMKPQDYITEVLKDKKKKTIYNIYEKSPRIRGVKQVKIKREEFLYPTWYLSNSLDTQLVLIPSRIELYETLKNPSQKEYLLDKFLKKYAHEFDYILIDCPPTPSILTISAFAASDYVIIPVTPDYFSTIGLPQFLGTLDSFKDDLYDSHDIKPLGVVFTNVPRVLLESNRKAIKQVKDSLAKIARDIPVLDSKLSYFKILEKCIWQSVPVHRVTGRGLRGKKPAMAELHLIAEEIKSIIEKSETSRNGE